MELRNLELALSTFVFQGPPFINKLKICRFLNGSNSVSHLVLSFKAVEMPFYWFVSSCKDFEDELIPTKYLRD